MYDLTISNPSNPIKHYYYSHGKWDILIKINKDLTMFGFYPRAKHTKRLPSKSSHKVTFINPSRGTFLYYQLPPTELISSSVVHCTSCAQYQSLAIIAFCNSKHGVPKLIHAIHPILRIRLPCRSAVHN